MFEKTGVKIIGLIDNMSIFKGDDGKEYKILVRAGLKKLQKNLTKYLVICL